MRFAVALVLVLSSCGSRTPVNPKVDMAPTCNPPCGAFAPYCNASLNCVGCASDAQCLVDSYCKVVSASEAECVKGCKNSDRCAGSTQCCGGQCTDTTSDALNCGGCGKSCAMLHVVCEGSVCQPGKCAAGFGDCNMDPKDGCETSLADDGMNCGACGMACPRPAHAAATCAMGMCGVGACDVGFADCNQDAKDGCEANLDFDPKNCGKCLTACGMGMGCDKGMCSQCNTSFSVLEKKDVVYSGVSYLLLKVGLKSLQSAGASWCDDYLNLCRCYGYLPTGCGQQFTMKMDGYGTCRSTYMSDGVSDTLGCNPSGGVSAAARAAGYNDATTNNSFGFHYCDGNTCAKQMCNGANCNTALSYIDASMQFGYTLCKKP